MFCSTQVYGGIKRFVHVSTDEVYGSSYSDEPSRTEGDVLDPTNPYAATKAAAEAIARSYWTSFKLPVIVTRGNNVFGPHQYPEKVIPKFIRRLVNGQSCCIHGDGSNSRHYVYVGDVAAAFDTVTHSGVNGEIYNIGCHEEFTNMQARYRRRRPPPDTHSAPARPEQVAERLVRAIKPEVEDVKKLITLHPVPSRRPCLPAARGCADVGVDPPASVGVR